MDVDSPSVLVHRSVDMKFHLMATSLWNMYAFSSSKNENFIFIVKLNRTAQLAKCNCFGMQLFLLVAVEYLVKN